MQAAAFVRLAGPMFVSRAGVAAMSIVDAVLVSRYDARQLAVLGLAQGTLGRVFDVLAALALGGLVLIARARGAGDAATARRIWRRTLPWAAGLGLLGAGAGLAGGTVLRLAGQDPMLARDSGVVTAIIGASHPAALLALATAVFLEATGRPLAVAACVVAANGLNLALDWLLIAGHLRMPALGAAGAALSTGGVNVALAACLLIVARASRRAASPGSEGGGGPHGGATWREQAGLSGGAGLTALVMNLLAGWLTIFGGWLGALPLAALTGVFTLNAPVMLMALGMADATALQVAQAQGAGGTRCRGVLAVNMGMAALPLSVCMAMWVGAPGMLASLFTTDGAQHAQLVGLIPLAGGVLALDALGMIAVAALRGLGDVAGALVIPAAAMAAMVPLAATLAFSAGLGVRGLLLAVLATSALRLALLLLRFATRSQPAIRAAARNAGGLDGHRIA